MSKPPVMTGLDARGKPRIRANADGFQEFVVGEYRNMGLQRPGDIGVISTVSSARTEVERNRAKGLRNSRDAERQNELIRGGLDRKSTTVVGPNIRPNPQPDLTWLNQQPEWMLDYQQAAISVFNEWGNDIHCRCDAEGHYQFGGLMWQGHRTMAGPDAEISGMIGYDPDRRGAGWKWGTFVKLIDGDRLNNPQGQGNGPDRVVTGTAGPAGGFTAGRGNDRLAGLEIYDGREVDVNGAMQALWFSSRHPTDPGSDQMQWERIPRIVNGGRAMGFHWFIKRRPGLQRALTTLAAVLSTVDYLGQHSRATLQHEVSRAYMAAYVKTTMTPEQAAEHLAPGSPDASNPNGWSDWDIKADAYDKMNLSFGGKRLPILGPNDEIKFDGLNGAQLDFDPFRNAFLRELASALGTSFEQLSLDFSRSSYSSTRSSIIEAWRAVEFERYMFCSHVPSLIYDAVIEEAFALGILKPPPGAPSFYEARAAYTRVTWTGPGMGWVDPLKEVNAANARMGSLISNLSRETSSQGGDWHELMQQRAIELALAKKLNIPIDLGTGVTREGNIDDAAAAAVANAADETAAPAGAAQ